LPAFDAILAAVAPASGDTLVLLGDYIDRGPASRGVIERALELEKQCHVAPLMGNHEVMLLDVLHQRDDARMWLQYGGRETLASYGQRLEDVPRTHREFFERLLPYYEMETHFFVHANYAADLPLDEQPDYLLFWEHLSPEHYPARHESGKAAIVGHTAQRSGEVLDLGHIQCIDTFCHGGGWLTALDVASGRLWQADRQGRRRGSQPRL
jgi:serine/threonine protein phosphatase 1